MGTHIINCQVLTIVVEHGHHLLIDLEGATLIDGDVTDFGDGSEFRHDTI